MALSWWRSRKSADDRSAESPPSSMRLRIRSPNPTKSRGDFASRPIPNENYRFMSWNRSPAWCLSLTLSLGAVFAQDTQNLPKSSDWNRIPAISPGMVTRVKILKNEAIAGERIVKGFFSSSTDTSITVLFRDGTTRTIERGVISTVRVRRPFKKRTTGWVIGLSTAVIAGYLYAGPGTGDISPAFKFIMPALITAPAAVGGFFMMPTRLVYRAPPVP